MFGPKATASTTSEATLKQLNPEVTVSQEHFSNLQCRNVMHVAENLYLIGLTPIFHTGVANESHEDVRQPCVLLS